jgi:Spy/CpxP family protein refolding chaperone
MKEEPVMMNASRYAAILVWGSVVLLSANVQTVRADAEHGEMMGGHMCKMHEGHDQSKQDEHSCHDLKHLLKQEKEIGLTSEQISKLKAMQLDLSRAQVRAEADIKVATLELHALVEDEQADSAAIQAKVDQLKKAEGSLLFATIKSKRDAMAVLTPEQREKENALRDKMMEKMKGGEDQHTGGMSGMSGMKGGGHGKGGEHGKDGGAGKAGAAEHQH